MSTVITQDDICNSLKKFLANKNYINEAEAKTEGWLLTHESAFRTYMQNVLSVVNAPVPHSINAVHPAIFNDDSFELNQVTSQVDPSKFTMEAEAENKATLARIADEEAQAKANEEAEAAAKAEKSDTDGHTTTAPESSANTHDVAPSASSPDGAPQEAGPASSVSDQDNGQQEAPTGQGANAESNGDEESEDEESDGMDDSDSDSE